MISTIHRRVLAWAAGALLWAPVAAWGGATLSKVSGVVQLRGGGQGDWRTVPAAPHPVSDGDTVRTAVGAEAVLEIEGSGKIELGPNSTFTLERAVKAEGSFLRLEFGRLKAFVNRLAGSQRFQVKTPTAVCSVRGTEFQIEVLSGGRTVIDLYKGLLAVEDGRGQQILLHPNERLRVDASGLGAPGISPTQSEARRESFQSVMRREMSLDMSKEEVLAAAAREIKLAEFQQGKVLMDVFGQRVRLEEYIVRPRADQFKLVVLNERQARFDYFYYLGTFNTTLPADLSVALRQISGSVDNAPTFWLTGFETGRSNTRDSMIELAAGGHPVDVNSNADATDNVSFFYNAATDRYEDVTGRAVYQTLFDRYGFYINGGLKYGWTGTNIASYADTTAATTNDPHTGALLPAVLPARSVSTTFPDANQVHQMIYESYSDGTFTQWDNYIINDEGKIARQADFAGVTSGAKFKQKLLDFNYEQVITASEFQGRKIDLVVEPKILIQSGLIQ